MRDLPKDTPLRNRARKILLAQTAEFRDRNRNTVCPVYDLDGRGELDLLGSAVLLKVGSAHFAVSARHVFDRLKTKSLALGGEELTELVNQKYFFTSGAPSVDRFDLAFVKLSPEQVNDLGKCRFLSVSELDLSERPNFDRPFGSKYFLLGYPCSKQKRPMSGIPTAPVSLIIQVLPAPPQKYAPLRAAMDSHLLLDLDRKDVSSFEGSLTAPKLNGMSGGGVWTAPRDLSSQQPRERLLAILIEHHEGSAKTIVSTRIGGVLVGISKHFPGLRRALEVF